MRLMMMAWPPIAQILIIIIIVQVVRLNVKRDIAKHGYKSNSMRIHLYSQILIQPPKRYIFIVYLYTTIEED